MSDSDSNGDEWTQLRLAIDHAITSMGTFSSPLEQELMDISWSRWQLERAKRVERVMRNNLQQDSRKKALPIPYMAPVIAFIRQAFEANQSVQIWGLTFYPDGSIGGRVTEREGDK
jgi:hypothetical protein